MLLKRRPAWAIMMLASTLVVCAGLSDDTFASSSSTMSAITSIVSRFATDARSAMDAASAGTAGCSANMLARVACITANGTISANVSYDFGQYVPRDYDWAQTKLVGGGVAAVALPEQQRLCAAAGLPFSNYTNLYIVPSSSSSAYQPTGWFAHRFFASSADNMVVYPPVAWDCAGAANYTPSARPYYNAAAYGRKDLIIVVDVSDTGDSNGTARVSAAVVIALRLLQSLSHRDYVGIVTYSDMSDTSVTPVLVKATAANVATLAAVVGGLTTRGSGAGLAAGLRTAVELLRASAAAGATSACSSVVVVLGSGQDDAPADDPLQVVLDSSHTTIFMAVYIAPTAAAATVSSSAVAATALPRIACAGGGIVVGVGVGGGAARGAVLQDAAAQILRYLAVALPTFGVTWSEASTSDGFGSGLVSTASAPIYDAGGTLVGVVGINVPVQTWGRAFSAADANLAIEKLTPSAECVKTSARFGYPDKLKALRSLGHCGSVTSLPRAYPTLPDRTNRDAYIIITVVIAVLAFVAPMIATRCVDRDAGASCAFFAGSQVFGLIMWAAALSVFWTLVFDAAVVNAHFVPVPAQVVMRENRYRCCRVGVVFTGSSCFSAANASLVATCASLVALGMEGACSNGAECCSMSCVSCNCYTVTYSCGYRGSTLCRSTICKRCCKCDLWASSTLRAVECAVCSKPSFALAYAFGGVAYTVRDVGSCTWTTSTSLEKCASDWYRTRTLGNVSVVYVNPSNPNEFVATLPLDWWMATLAGAFTVLAVMCMVLAVRDVVRTRVVGEDNGDDPTPAGHRSSPPWPTPSLPQPAANATSTTHVPFDAEETFPVIEMQHDGRYAVVGVVISTNITSDAAL